MNTTPTPPPAAPATTALVERLKRAIVDCAQEAFDSDNDGYRFTAEAFRFHVASLQSAITHLAAHAELQARCARLEEDGKRLTDLDDVMIWVSIETGSRNGGLNPKISGNAPIRTLIDRTLAAARTAKEAT